MIIGVGLHRTGTTSLGLALNHLGYQVKGHSPNALFPILRKDFQKIKRSISSFSALEDVPWCIIFKELDVLFPGSKFILTYRDEEAWYKSARSRFQNFVRAENEWIYGRGQGDLANKSNAIRRYRAHNLSVIEYFKGRPADLLQVDLSEGEPWGKICGFLNLPVPNIPFPHANKSATTSKPLSGWKLQRKKIKNQLKVKFLDYRGYLEKTN